MVSIIAVAVFASTVVITITINIGNTITMITMNQALNPTW